MSDLEYVKPEFISLATHPAYNEKWVQAKIAAEPSIIGLGELILLDVERKQPRSGRLDLLLSDQEFPRRYEVEIQLGATDESHIIRTIEYWDIERKRYPQYDHCAVIIAENITSRFLNVISLFNGHIPLIAIQMKAVRIKDAVSLLFTTVLDEMPRGMDEGETAGSTYARANWETSTTNETLCIVDDMLGLVREVSPECELNYTKHYIGLAIDGVARNFVSFVPMKKHTTVYFHLSSTEEIDSLIEDAELDQMSYDRFFGNYRVRLRPGDVNEKRETLHDLVARAFEAYPA